MVPAIVPVPLPFVKEKPDARVGLAFVLQQIPRLVTVPPPSDVMLPVAAALLLVIEFTAPVDSVGTWILNVVKLICGP